MAWGRGTFPFSIYIKTLSIPVKKGLIKMFILERPLDDLEHPLALSSLGMKKRRMKMRGGQRRMKER